MHIVVGGGGGEQFYTLNYKPRNPTNIKEKRQIRAKDACSL